MLKILTVVGARPQFIKAAAVSRAIAEYNASHQGAPILEVIVHSGQHYDINMSDVFFTEMNIPRPNHRLNLTKSTHGAMTAEILTGVEEVIIAEKPDIILVYGDTNTTLAGALAAAKLHVPVAHVEAGLRSFNMQMPEEINRVLTDRISRWLFCPTDAAVNNLANEGFRQASEADGPFVVKVGDVMYDAALYYKAKAIPTESVSELTKQTPDGYYLATIHRAENTDDHARLSSIMKALDDISVKTPVILPLHPRTRKLLLSYDITPRKIKIIEAVGYFDMLWLLDNCRGVLTDSGGLQKEAYFFGKPCITLRDETEWIELIEGGYNVLAGAYYSRILATEQELAHRKLDYSMQLYGAGNASGRIIEELAAFF